MASACKGKETGPAAVRGITMASSSSGGDFAAGASSELSASGSGRGQQQQGSGNVMAGKGKAGGTGPKCECPPWYMVYGICTKVMDAWGGLLLAAAVAVCSSKCRTHGCTLLLQCATQRVPCLCCCMSAYLDFV